MLDFRSYASTPPAPEDQSYSLDNVQGNDIAYPRMLAPP
jgi:hypothetical protein